MKINKEPQRNQEKAVAECKCDRWREGVVMVAIFSINVTPSVTFNCWFCF